MPRGASLTLWFVLVLVTGLPSAAGARRDRERPDGPPEKVAERLEARAGVLQAEAKGEWARIAQTVEAGGAPARAALLAFIDDYDFAHVGGPGRWVLRVPIPEVALARVRLDQETARATAIAFVDALSRGDLEEIQVHVGYPFTHSMTSFCHDDWAELVSFQLDFLYAQQTSEQRIHDSFVIPVRLPDGRCLEGDRDRWLAYLEEWTGLEVYLPDHDCDDLALNWERKIEDKLLDREECWGIVPPVERRIPRLELTAVTVATTIRPGWYVPVRFAGISVVWLRQERDGWRIIGFEVSHRPW